MSWDGIQSQTRFGDLTYQKISAKVIDNILTGQSYAMRLLGMGKVFDGKTMDFPIKISNSGLGEFFVGLETLGLSASDTLVTLSYAQSAFTQPVASIMLESFANSGPQQAINLDVYKMEEAQMEAMNKLGVAFYGTGSANQPLGLGAIVDDGTDVGTIGGQSRTTYTTLKATRTASGGTVSLAKLATLEDTVVAGGIESEEPNLNLTTKTVWSLYEQLLTPQQRANYEQFGGDVLPLRGNTIGKRTESGAAGGFTVLAYRGKPLLKDDAATSGNWFMLNERYFYWMGRNTVPEKYQGKLEPVTLGATITEGTGPETLAPKSNGWFFQTYQILPQQAGMVARYYLIGQVCGTQFRRQGRLTGITGV